jgi:hypothetical protein
MIRSGSGGIYKAIATSALKTRGSVTLMSDADHDR